MKARGRRSVCKAYVFAGVSTGLARLSCDLDIPVVHVDVAIDAALAIRHLNRVRHGSGVLWPGGLFPIRFDKGWGDWSIFPLERAPGKPPMPHGLCFAEGLLEVPLPDGSTLPEFREQLSGSMRHLRIEELARSPRWVNDRSRRGEDLVCHPRYTSAAEDCLDADLVRDLYAINPLECSERVLWLATSALLAANGRGVPGGADADEDRRFRRYALGRRDLDWVPKVADSTVMGGGTKAHYPATPPCLSDYLEQGPAWIPLLCVAVSAAT